MKINLFQIAAFVIVVFLAGCGKSDTQTSGNDKTDKQTEKDQQSLQVSAGDRSVEIHTSGMTCTGCENTIKAKVKKVDGVKDVIADFKTNVVKASFDPGKTNPEAISKAIESAGYEVKSAN